MTAPELDLFRRISNQGHRLTRARRTVIRALERAAAPLSVRALHEGMGTDGPDLVTVYRTLRWLMEIGVVRAVRAGPGGDRFELGGPDPHLHHLRCDRCGAVRTVAECGLDEAVLARIQREFRFGVTHHHLVLHGLCFECMQAARRAASS
ncbi:MAG TPA: Fur family transcriptional regulator [Longimicrobium sp.]|nr:Fur family transcriptional regulator [Longimicrobium sp.]